jgi:hypothetical protein
MPDEKHDDEIDDEMPDPGAAPCGDIFGTSDTTWVTDADAEVFGDEDRD